MAEDERARNVLASWFGDPGATQAVQRVDSDYSGKVRAMGGSVIRQTPPPQDGLGISEVETEYLPRWRAGGVMSHGGSVCPKCYAGYVFGRVEQMSHPDLAALCYACQVELEAQALQVAAALSHAYGYAIRAFDVLTRYFAEVLPITPMARRYGHPYEPSY